jgi:ubiquitin carboxyl-terminal hydrolase 9/24
MLEGENAYFCDGCDKKVKALKRLSIKRLPPHLIISLRRFEFDYEADQKIKINKYCEFPFELNLENYSQDKLNESNPNLGRKPEQRSSSSMNDE